MHADGDTNTTIRERKIAIVEKIFAARGSYTPFEWGIAQLYYRCGLSHQEISRIFHVERSTVSHAMRNVRRKAASKHHHRPCLQRGERELENDHKGA
jgi:DNA-binding NarL/FixJ family response regulator